MFFLKYINLTFLLFAFQIEVIWHQRPGNTARATFKESWKEFWKQKLLDQDNAQTSGTKEGHGGWQLN